MVSANPISRVPDVRGYGNPKVRQTINMLGVVTLGLALANPAYDFFAKNGREIVDTLTPSWGVEFGGDWRQLGLRRVGLEKKVSDKKEQTVLARTGNGKYTIEGTDDKNDKYNLTCSWDNKTGSCDMYSKNSMGTSSIENVVANLRNEAKNPNKAMIFSTRDLSDLLNNIPERFKKIS